MINVVQYKKYYLGIPYLAMVFWFYRLYGPFNIIFYGLNFCLSIILFLLYGFLEYKRPNHEYYYWVFFWGTALFPGFFVLFFLVASVLKGKSKGRNEIDLDEERDLSDIRVQQGGRDKILYQRNQR